MIITHTPTIMTRVKAIETANILNADEDEDWTYMVVGYPHSKIAVYDEEGFFLGYL